MNAKRHVLVIDDDAVVGRSFDRVLSDKGYEVDTARNGEEGLKDIESQDYDGAIACIKAVMPSARVERLYQFAPSVTITREIGIPSACSNKLGCSRYCRN